MGDETRAALAFGIMFLAGIAGLSASLVPIDMTDQVNRKLPPEKQLGMRGWGRVSAVRAVKEYKRSYPGGPLLGRWLVRTGAFFALGAISASLLFGLLALWVDFGALAMFGVCCRLALEKQ